MAAAARGTEPSELRIVAPQWGHADSTARTGQSHAAQVRKVGMGVIFGPARCRVNARRPALGPSDTLA
jgi:hypothetical protein